MKCDLCEKMTEPRIVIKTPAPADRSATHTIIRYCLPCAEWRGVIDHEEATKLATKYTAKQVDKRKLEEEVDAAFDRLVGNSVWRPRKKLGGP